MTSTQVITTLKPCMSLVCEIEDELGGIPELFKKLSGCSWMVTELVTLIHIIFSAHGYAEDYERLGERMIADGLEGYRKTALIFLTKVMTS